MKYKVGDKVRVKNTEALEPLASACEAKIEFAGQVVTIESAADDELPYTLVEEGYGYYWSEDAFEPLTLKEQYFQTGYVVEFRDGDKYIVLRDGDKVALAEQDGNKSWNGWNAGNGFDDDLLHESLTRADIMKVYPQACRWNGPLSEPIWQREEPKEMTIEEIEKLVGSKVKIVGEN